MPSWPPDPPRLPAGRIEKNASTSYTSSGVTAPVSAGVYTWAGEYNGQLYFRRADGNMFIWWNAPGERWLMSVVLGNQTANYWFSPTTAVPGTYIPSGTYTGSPVVTITP